jgi:hypothetical protein
MAGGHLDPFVARVEDIGGMANDDTETLVVALDVALEARTLLRAVHGAIERRDAGERRIRSSH